MRNILIYAAVSGMLLLSSCNDWLDVQPKSQVPEKEMFRSEEGFKDALTACYIKMNAFSLYGRSLTMSDIEKMAQHWYRGSFPTPNDIALKDYDYTNTSVENLVKSIYSGLYNVISQANTVLGNLSANGHVITNPQLRDVIEAEALGIRAFCHLDILRFFGQMPKNPTKTVSLSYMETVSLQNTTQDPFDQFVQKIVADIDKALKLLEGNDPLLLPTPADPSKTYGYVELYLPEDYLSYRRFRVNYHALNAMKARLYMYTGNKTEAFRCANLVIDQGKLVLAETQDITDQNYVLPSECIFALSNFEMTKNVTDELFQAGTGGLHLSQPQYNEMFLENLSSDRRAISQWDRLSTGDMGVISPTIRKYWQPDYKILDADNNLDLMINKQVIPLIRLSEMYLIAAESAPSLEQANAFYAAFMKAKGIVAQTKTQEQLAAELVKEYRREFFAEGQMFYAYKRWGTQTMLWKVDRNVSENDYVVPLPKTELKSN